MELLVLHKAIKKPPRSDERDGELFCGTEATAAERVWYNGGKVYAIGAQITDASKGDLYVAFAEAATGVGVISSFSNANVLANSNNGRYSAIAIFTATEDGTVSVTANFSSNGYTNYLMIYKVIF